MGGRVGEQCHTLRHVSKLPVEWHCQLSIIQPSASLHDPRSYTFHTCMCVCTCTCYRLRGRGGLSWWRGWGWPSGYWSCLLLLLRLAATTGTCRSHSSRRFILTGSLYSFETRYGTKLRTREWSQRTRNPAVARAERVLWIPECSMKYQAAGFFLINLITSVRKRDRPY